MRRLLEGLVAQQCNVASAALNGLLEEAAASMSSREALESESQHQFVHKLRNAVSCFERVVFVDMHLKKNKKSAIETPAVAAAAAPILPRSPLRGGERATFTESSSPPQATVDTTTATNTAHTAEESEVSDNNNNSEVQSTAYLRLLQRSSRTLMTLAGYVRT